MQLFLDGAPLDPPAEPTLAAALDAAQRRAGGRLVVQALADGIPVPAEELADPPDITPYADRLDLTTAEPAELAADSLDTAAETLERSIEQHTTTAHALQDGDVDGAFAHLTTLLTAWQQAIRAVELSGQIPGLDLEELWRSGQVEAGAATLRERLRELAQAVQSHDWPGVADTIELDLVPAARQWGRALRDGAQLARAATDGTPPTSAGRS